MGDLEQMFFQICVPEGQRSLLTFLWWPDGDVSKEPEEYEMCVHPFGLISSPSVAGYALRKAASDNIDVFGKAAADAVLKNFYVDDLCKSEVTSEIATTMIRNIEGLCAARGFNLTKIVSNDREVLNSIPIEKRIKELQDPDSSDMNLIVKSALGVPWNVGKDTLGFRISFSERELSRRVLLSDLSSAYDPDGRCSAFLLPGKRVLQEITAIGIHCFKVNMLIVGTSGR